MRDGIEQCVIFDIGDVGLIVDKVIDGNSFASIEMDVVLHLKLDGLFIEERLLLELDFADVDIICE